MSPVNQAIKSAKEAYERNDLDSARKICIDIIRGDPDQNEANHLLGLVLTKMGQTLGALVFLQKAVEGKNVDPNYWLNYINVLISNNLLNSAQLALKGIPRNKISDQIHEKLIAIISRYSTQNPGASKNARNDIEEFEKKLSRKQFLEAAQLGFFLMKQYPRDLPLLKGYTASLMQLGKVEQAYVVATEGAKIGAKDAFAHYNLAVVLQKLERWKEAVDSYNRAIVIDSSQSVFFNNLGALLKNLGDYEGARINFERAIERNPKFIQAHNNLGNLFKDQQKTKDAELCYRRALEIEPAYAEAHVNLGVVLHERDKHEEARKSLSSAINLNPRLHAAHYNNANVLKSLGRLAEAKEAYKVAIEIDRSAPNAYFSLGNTSKELNQFEIAETNFRKAIMLRPGYAEALLNLSIMIYAKDGIQKAQNYIKRVKCSNPSLKNGKLLETLLVPDKSEQNRAVAFHLNQSENNFNTKTRAPIIFKHPVTPELVNEIYKINSITLEQLHTPRFGKGIWSGHYDLFDDQRPVIQEAAARLTHMVRDAIGSDIYIKDSFFNILRENGGLVKHNHLGAIDKDPQIQLAERKYSLVYYLRTGDQSGKEPGILKLYDPDNDIMPTEGMVVIFPASQYHSAVYQGDEDRVLIGVNFYTL